MRMHKLDDRRLITPAILRRFEAEAEMEDGNGQHYAVIQRADKGFLDHNPGSPELDGMQAVFARDVLTMLNRELHHNGAWVMVFTHPAPFDFIGMGQMYRRFGLIWLDADGDPQFTLDWAEGVGEQIDFTDVLIDGKECWGDQAEAAWQSWHENMVRVIDPKSNQTYRRALGESAPSAAGA